MKLLWKSKLFLLATLAGVCCAQGSENETSSTLVFENDPRWLRLSDSHTNPFSVIVDDQVKDGCWTNTDSVSNAVKLELTRSGFNVNPTADDLLPHRIILHSIGYKTDSSLCLMYYKLQVNMIDLKKQRFGGGHEVTAVFYTELYSRSGVLSGGDTNSRLKTTFVDLIQSFLVDISKRRKDTLVEIKNKTPSEGKNFWDNYVL